MGDFRTGMSGGCMSIKYLRYGILPDHIFVNPIDGSGWTKYVPERTCKNIGEPKGSFLCSECRWGDFAPIGLPLKNAKFCPNCGAKVVG